MENEDKTNGALIGLVVIVIILIIGGIYIWQSRVEEIERLKAQNEALMAEQANIIKSLEQAIENTDTTIEIDTNTIK